MGAELRRLPKPRRRRHLRGIAGSRRRSGPAARRAPAARAAPRRNSAAASPALHGRGGRDGSRSRRAAQAAPQRLAPASAATVVSGAADAGQTSATAAAPAPPRAICPSAPILMTPARKHSATPRAGEQIRRRAVQRDADLMRRSRRAFGDRSEGFERVVARQSNQRGGARRSKAQSPPARAAATPWPIPSRSARCARRRR